MIFVSFSTEKNIIPCSYRDPLSHPISCTPTKSNLYLANSLAAVVNEPDLYMLLHSRYQVLCPFSIAEVVPRVQSRSEAHVSVS